MEEFETVANVSGSAVRGSAQLGLVGRPDPVYYGYHAASLSYDFTGETGTSAAYLNFKDPDGTAGRSIPGTPRAFGVWVYGDEGNHWLRAQLKDAAGVNHVVDLTGSTGFNWKGWKYVKFNVPASISTPLKLNQIYIAELKDTNKNSGTVYFDQLTAFYTTSNVYGLDIGGLTPMGVGETITPQVYATYEGQQEPTLLPSGPRFTSSDESIATVTGSNYDTIEALAPGTVTITAEYGDAPRAQMELHVMEEVPVPTELLLSGPLHLETSVTDKLRASVVYSVYGNNTNPIWLAEEVAYVSDQPHVVSVTADGQLTAVGTGSAIISATYKGTTAQHTITVSEPVPVLQSIELQGLTAVTVGDTFQTRVSATYSWIEEPVTVTEGVTYASTNPAAVAVDDKGVVTGLQIGSSRVTATYEGKTSSLYIVVNEVSEQPKTEMRAAWIATVDNIDWPTKGVTDPAQQKQQFIQLLDQLEDAGMNAVIMQIKPTADAFYPSEYGPWSEWLTGVQGQDPGYDPLAFLLEEVHRRNMEFHAWFNPYRISLQPDINKLVADHPARQNPSWVESYGGKLYFNPGVPEAQQFILDGIMEVVRNYDIDAVHFDDYFYPYPVTGLDFPDEDTYNQYKGSFTNKGDWRRNNVNQFIQNVNAAIKAEKSYVKFGISPFGIWRNKANDPAGSESNGLESYSAIYADSKKWVEEEWIDYITPQIYWNIGYAAAPYDKLIEWWSDLTAGKNVHLYSGQAVYKIGDAGDWSNPEEMPNQVIYNRNFEEVRGSMYFSSKWFKNNALGFTDRLKNDLYRYPALIPTMPWLDSTAPAALSRLEAAYVSDAVKLTWTASDDETYYAVYRFDGNSAGQLNDPSHLLGTFRKTAGQQQNYVDSSIVKNQQYTYVVTALDRLHNESGASPATTITAKGDILAPVDPPATSPSSPNPPITPPVTPTVTPPVTPPISPPVTPAGPIFNDLANVSWASEAIEKLASIGVVEGTGTGLFQPQKSVTRAEFLAMLVRAFHLSGVADLEFVDVNESDWHYVVIAAAVEAGLAQGVGGGKFEPNRPITREEMAIMSASALRLLTGIRVENENAALAKFKDSIRIASYAREAVALLAEQGVIQGTGGDLFTPKGTATRAQAAVIIFNLLNL
ncbi:family 10 glycosylhydrolase [Paenibacillus sp. JCM 10914]|uniref:family 10 glycosylhydrolase n=1 Tax=Paenibacillus sp. JCM 10914 TaxID=1236974 RepID=UPI000A7CC4A4|nr:family 10 glycosylhydrolase [Paenibacillus sp. JCM 10914]